MDACIRQQLWVTQGEPAMARMSAEQIELLGDTTYGDAIHVATVPLRDWHDYVCASGWCYFGTYRKQPYIACIPDQTDVVDVYDIVASDNDNNNDNKNTPHHHLFDGTAFRAVFLPRDHGTRTHVIVTYVITAFNYALSPDTIRQKAFQNNIIRLVENVFPPATTTTTTTTTASDLEVSHVTWRMPRQVPAAARNLHTHGLLLWDNRSDNDNTDNDDDGHQDSNNNRWLFMWPMIFARVRSMWTPSPSTTTTTTTTDDAEQQITYAVVRVSSDAETLLCVGTNATHTDQHVPVHTKDVRRYGTCYMTDAQSAFLLLHSPDQTHPYPGIFTTQPSSDESAALWRAVQYSWTSSEEWHDAIAYVSQLRVWNRVLAPTTSSTAPDEHPPSMPIHVESE